MIELLRDVSADRLLALEANRCLVTAGATRPASEPLGASRDLRACPDDDDDGGARLAPPECAEIAPHARLPRREACGSGSGMAAPSVMSESRLTAIEVLRTSSSISASVASSSSSGWSVMVTRGIHRFQSFHVSVLRSVRNTSDAGALIIVHADTCQMASDMGMSGVEKSVLVAVIFGGIFTLFGFVVVTFVRYEARWYLISHQDHW